MYYGNKLKMVIDTFEIGENQVFQILQFHEGHFGDLKRKEIKPALINLKRTLMLRRMR